MSLFEQLANATKPTSMNIERASLVVMSHLSDAQENLTISHERINFAKYIIFHCDGDLNKEINPVELWNKFKSK